MLRIFQVRPHANLGFSEAIFCERPGSTDFLVLNIGTVGNSLDEYYFANDHE